MIYLYRLPILFEWCERGCALEEVVFDVLTHEIGHHFGMDEDAVLRMEGRDGEEIRLGARRRGSARRPRRGAGRIADAPPG